MSQIRQAGDYASPDYQKILQHGASIFGSHHCKDADREQLEHEKRHCGRWFSGDLLAQLVRPKYETRPLCIPNGEFAKY